RVGFGGEVAIGIEQKLHSLSHFFFTQEQGIDDRLRLGHGFRRDCCTTHLGRFHAFCHSRGPAIVENRASTPPARGHHNGGSAEIYTAALVTYSPATAKALRWYTGTKAKQARTGASKSDEPHPIRRSRRFHLV